MGLKICIVVILFLDINNPLILQWGFKSGTGRYYGHWVDFPISFTTNPVVFSAIDWTWTATWYQNSTGTTTNCITDVAGTPCNISTSGFMVQSCSSHKYLAIGY